MEFNVELTERQATAFEYLNDEVTTSILYGGSKGGGKSYLLCLWILFRCKQLCDHFGLEPSPNPLALGFIGRKQSIDFKKTTLETWKRFIPAQAYEIKRQDGEIWLFNGACKIFYGGLDSRDTINKFNSAELAFFALDQAEETVREDVSVLRASLRLKHKGYQPCYKELYTANPSDCWLKEDFVDRKHEGYVYVPALPSDNPHLPNTYIRTLEEAFKHSPALLKAYRDGDWSAIKSSNLLISTEDLNKLQGLMIEYPQDKHLIVCDPATTHDECVIYYIKNNAIIEQVILVGESDTMKIAGHLATLAHKYKTKDIGGDSIGLGKGIFDRVRELGEFNVHYVNSAQASVNNRFLNLRAEIYWSLMQKIIDKKLAFPTDEKLRRQLVNVTYEVVDSSGKIKITEKDKIKKVIGSSPDRADAYAMGIYLMDKVEVIKRVDRYRTIDISPFNRAVI